MTAKSPIAAAKAPIENATERIHKMNDAINNRLAAILGRQCHIDAKMNSIGRSLSSLRQIRTDSGQLCDTITNTARLAENVSAKVRRLDEARTRVSDCQQRVHDLIDLQLCAAGVTAAIDAENFEAAAGHIHRFLSMDQSLLQRTAGVDGDSDGTPDAYGSGSGDSIVQAVATLEAAAAQLRQLITERFDEAVARDDLASVERFFKIFPLLRMHDAGIARFSDYICTKLQAKAARELRSSLDVAKANRRTAVAYADTLTVMFENLARVVEVNQPIVEACYGHGHLVRMVVRLQRECDEQFRRLLNEFQNGRHVPHRMAQIDEQLAIKSTGGSLSASVADPDGSNANNSTSNATSIGTAAAAAKGHRRNRSGNSSIDKLNPKDIDGLLGEITVMLSRADLYVRFMRRKVTADLEQQQQQHIASCASTSSDTDAEAAAAAERAAGKLKLFEDTLAKSDLNRQTQELLNIYLLFERYFIEESVLKAIALDVCEPGQLCSSMVDDVFFIVRKSIRRAASTQSLSGCCAVINNATAVLETDVASAMHAALRAGYPSGYIDLAAHAYNALHSSIQLAGRLPANNDMTGDRVRAQFVVQLNNADQAAEHVQTLCQQMGDEIRAVTAATASDREREILDSCLAALRAVRDRMRAEVEFGLQQLRSSVLRPRLHTWIVDQFVARGHEPSDEELAAYETTGETFVQSLIVQLDGLLAQFKTVMAERNYDALVAMLATDVTARMEAAIRKCTFNRLGGLVLDQEVRTLGLFLSAATSWSVRDKMVRLTQMATLLNLEQLSELSEYWQPVEQASSAGLAWRFSHAEVKAILSLRSDFRTADIKRIKF